ncbi:MAG: hypothetical protein RRX92_07375 [Lachnospiraceae bacterium]
MEYFPLGFQDDAAYNGEVTIKQNTTERRNVVLFGKGMVMNMRKYAGAQNNELAEIVCNQCGRQLKIKNGILREGCFEGTQKFGYFSNKDGQVECFDLCEACYRKLTKEFTIPVEVQEATEYL